MEEDTTRTAARTTDVIPKERVGKGGQRKQLEPIKGTEIGLAVYTSKSNGWEKEQISYNKIARKMEEGRFKWTYTDKLFEES